MAVTRLRVAPNGEVNYTLDEGGRRTSYVLPVGASLDGVPSEVASAAREAWTPEVISAAASVAAPEIPAPQQQEARGRAVARRDLRRVLSDDELLALTILVASGDLTPPEDAQAKVVLRWARRRLAGHNDPEPAALPSVHAMIVR